MKNLIIILALSLSVGSAYSQKLKEADVPAAVKESFKKLYPKGEIEKWEKEDGVFEAEFESDETEGSITFDASGVVQETEIEIKVSELPKGVAEYVDKNLSGKKIKEASKITDSKGAISYEAEVGKEGYMFDADGKFLKKEDKEKDKD